MLVMDRTFLGRHAHLMDNPNTALVCCYWDEETQQYACTDQATHGVIAEGRWTVCPVSQLPPLRDEYEKQGEPSRLRRHPQFCLPHAEQVCTAWNTGKLPRPRAGTPARPKTTPVAA